MSYRSFMIAFADSSLARSLFYREGAKPALVRRFVAGDQLSDALETAGSLATDRIDSTIHYLGENLNVAADVLDVVMQTLEVIKAVSTFCPTAQVSVKLSGLGLLMNEDLARENLRRIVAYARERGDVFVRVDMEASEHTDTTLGLIQELHGEFGNIGATIQAGLRRSDRDIDDLNNESISVRLVKGRYSESPATAYSMKADIARQFRKQMINLLENGVSPVIATHDPQLISEARIFARRQSIKSNQYSFEMYMGVRRDLQKQLRGEGHSVRVYIPYGTRWYPYFTRRFAQTGSMGLFSKGIDKK